MKLNMYAGVEARLGGKRDKLKLKLKVLRDMKSTEPASN
jgi:hypothetical protein